MLEYTFAKAILMLLICRSYTLDYPCIKSNCGITEICYPVALNCRNGNCSYRDRCLEKNKFMGNCLYGNILIKDDETPYHCNSNQQCPGQTFCHVNNNENNRVCCWKRDPVQKNHKTQIQTKAPRETIHVACPLPNPFANCNKDCEDDTDCDADQRCCFNGCGRLCITIDSKNNQNRKAGECPVDKPPIFLCSMRLRCYTDNDCAGNFICCHISGCGSICRAPARGNTHRALTNVSTQRSSGNQSNSLRRNRQLQRKPVNTARNLQNFNPQSKSTVPQRDNLRNSPSPNFNSDLTQSFQFGFKRCPWFQVLYGGC